MSNRIFAGADAFAQKTDHNNCSKRTIPPMIIIIPIKISYWWGKGKRKLTAVCSH
ncbi:hypothetical protein ECJURUA1811_4142 [Escherichia coli Jurua 18/11]|nr:hypothetical protein ECDEC14C_4309 [Escherichia coli DEC14C]EMU76968.1 hypothetical protein ECMP0210179_3004 [Escherichia coli MP021017.9]EMU79888.1 hypothetical protein ECMP0210175_3398 [Escherichia coli MP021017.5]EMU88903.1 hypothetical protein ECMP0210174_4167 [Escherichia coli MP021017.4]EMV04920.1 hypothetical protein ECMP02101710_3478 [Escherichia coli MP021017.10]EMV17694.1 hypothetical protein ECBCE034MS14_4381 [Escherichia coli BCE034_MS-14]EMV83449.1 hypothetical protein EC28612